MKGDFFFVNFCAITSSFITASNYISSWRSKNKTFE